MNGRFSGKLFFITNGPCWSLLSSGMIRSAAVLYCITVVQSFYNPEPQHLTHEAPSLSVMQTPFMERAQGHKNFALFLQS